MKISEKQLRETVEKILREKREQDLQLAIEHELRSHVRRVLREDEEKGSEESWIEAGSGLASDVANWLLRTTLDTVVGQAHAPSSEKDVAAARAGSMSIEKQIAKVLPRLPDLLNQTAFVLSAYKAGIGAKLILALKSLTGAPLGADDEQTKLLATAADIHNLLAIAAVGTGAAGAVGAIGAGAALAIDAAAAALDGAIYAAEGDKRAAIVTFVAAGILSTPGAVKHLAKADNAAIKGATRRLVNAEVTSYRSFQQASEGGLVLRSGFSPYDIIGTIEALINSLRGKGLDDSILAGIREEAEKMVNSGKIDPLASSEARAIQMEAAASKLLTPGENGIAPIEAARRWRVNVDEVVKGETGGQPWLLAGDKESAELQYKKIGQDVEALKKRSANVMGTPAFKEAARKLYSNLGANVNIKPINASWDTVSKELGSNTPVATKVGQNLSLEVRTVIVPAEEAKPILQRLKISTEGVGSDTITIVPASSLSGLDAMPTPWMIMHALFDSGGGKTILASKMTRTKEIVDSVMGVFDGLPKWSSTEATSNPLRQRLESPKHLLGISVDSTWGRNSQNLQKQFMSTADQIDDIIKKNPKNPGELGGEYANRIKKIAEKSGISIPKELAAPPVGKQLTAGELPKAGKLKAVSQGVENADDYLFRGETDWIAEAMTAAVGKEKGYTFNTNPMQNDLLFRVEGGRAIPRYKFSNEVNAAGRKIQSILGKGGENAKQAFGEDLKGMVVFVYPN